MITICLTYFKSLTPANLAAALYSVSRQDLSHVTEVIVLDNDTSDDAEQVQRVIDGSGISVPVRLISIKHGDQQKTHSWSTNMVVGEVQTSWVLFTRADYLLAYDAVERFAQAVGNDNQFIVGRYYDVTVDIAACETIGWRNGGLETLQSFGREYDHVLIDSGVWMTRKETFDKVGGLDERLTAWGHAQTHFQHKLFVAGVEFVRIPFILFYHPTHGYPTPRDITRSHEQLHSVTGLNIKDCWARYSGPDNPYR